CPRTAPTAQQKNPARNAPAHPPKTPPSPPPPTKTPTPPRFNSKTCLPRPPKPLGEDRAQALVALNNTPKRSFQRSHIQPATKPNRQRDHVAPARPLQPLQKPQPALPI